MTLVREKEREEEPRGLSLMVFGMKGRKESKK